MKINNVDIVIQYFRDGQNIFRRPLVELMVREISRLRQRIAELEIQLKSKQALNEMTEFTKEFIDQQKQLAKKISPLPWTACSCGKCGSISNETDAIAKVTMGDWGDDYPDIRRIGGSIEGKFETFMNQITYGNIPKETGTINAQYIANACNNYPEALDEIERLQARVQELEQERRWISVEERLPEDSRVYDVAIAGYEYSWTGTCVFGKWIGETGKPLLGVTHWKYRPQIPEERE